MGPGDRDGLFNSIGPARRTDLTGATAGAATGIALSSPKFGFTEVSVGPEQAVSDGVLAEKAGFDSVWIPDHFTDVNGDKLEPWTCLAAIGALTERVELGPAVTDTQRTHPTRSAHAVACLDGIAPGRALLGIGAGEAMNVVPFGLPWGEPAERAARLEEAVRVIKLLWSSTREDQVDYSGKYYTMKSAFLSLHPVRKPHPPVYIGAMGARTTLEIVGREGDGWFAWLNTRDQFRKRWKIIEEAARAAGRNPKKIDSASHCMVALPRDADERKAAMLGAKATLLMEKKTLESMGYTDHLKFLQYQNFTISNEYVKKIFTAASEIPDEYVHKVMAVGSIDDIRALIEQMTKTGVKHLIVADHLAPKSTKRTFEAFKKLIREYR
jgi:phthiodiolone/phenolphthiodiolone dimycocerosates ketoreductase